MLDIRFFSVTDAHAERRKERIVRQRPTYTGELVKIRTLLGLGAAVLIVLAAVIVANAVIGLVVGGDSGCNGWPGGSVPSWCADE
jgi:hypothetical protein